MDVDTYIHTYYKYTNILSQCIKFRLSTLTYFSKTIIPLIYLDFICPTFLKNHILYLQSLSHHLNTSVHVFLCIRQMYFSPKLY